MTEITEHNHAYSSLLSDLGNTNKDLRTQIPDVFHGYAALSSAVLKDGALPVQIKELIALAMGIAQHCDGCIASHARSAFRAGATREEVAETLGVAIMLMGGPGTVYVAHAWDAYREFANDTRS